MDADVIARQIVQFGTDALSQIVKRYGNNILLADGSLSRARLRQKIFSEQKEREWLNSLLHPLIQQKTRRRITETKEPYLI
ncbi:MAG: dephospho-CoA kinase, partial [Candidatus Regiella insecticola]|nr:dephospho-CoA kinase [Candidatus Regiella insecticola]